MMMSPNNSYSYNKMMRTRRSPQKVILTLWCLMVGLLTAASIFVSIFYFPTSSEHHQRGEEAHQRGLSGNEEAETIEGGDGGNGRPEVPQRYKTISNIAWLLSFPNSGTTYTLANVEHVSNLTTATNYDSEVLSDVLYPVNPDLEDAPFLFSPRLATGKYVLTKTHCVGYSYCDDCHHSQVVQDLQSFEEGCRTANINIRLPARETDHTCREENRYFQYTGNHILKVVHLVRNPFDNVVARMHLGVELRRREPERMREPDRHLLDKFNDTRDGVRAWCSYIDGVFHDEASLYRSDGVTFRGKPSDASMRNVSIPSSTMNILMKVPCHSEWFRYVQWHNLAVRAYREKLRTVSDAQIVYYEDYTRDLTTTSRQLAAFLEQPVVREDPLPFVSGKVYRHLFSDEDRLAIARLVYELATPECWRLLKWYFGDWFDENKHTVPKEEEADDDDDRTASADDVSTTINPNNTKLAWLISFPQSGSKLTAKNLNVMTGAELASHYWSDSGPDQDLLWSNMTYSPVLVNPRGSHTPQRVLTRNHCTGYCSECQPVELYRNFDRMCSSVTRKIGDNVTVGAYPREHVESAVLLVRNPFDVIRSRATRGVIEKKEALNLTDQQATGMRDTREALLRWCSIVDQQFADNDEGPPPSPSQNKPTWNILYRSLIAARRWRNRRFHCPNLLFSVDERYGQFSRKLPEKITDENATEYTIDRDLLDKYRSIPCYSDWLRYVQWHNYALQEIADLPRYTMRFENYLDDPQGTLMELIHYLDLTAAHSPRRFNRERASHKQLYTPDEARGVAEMVRRLSSDETWGLLRHYFKEKEWFDESVDTVTVSSAS